MSDFISLHYLINVFVFLIYSLNYDVLHLNSEDSISVLPLEKKSTGSPTEVPQPIYISKFKSHNLQPWIVTLLQFGQM